jgi:hypothetical protein
MDFRCGQLKPQQTTKTKKQSVSDLKKKTKYTHEMRNANHMSSYGGSSSPSHTNERRTSRWRAVRRTADETTYPSGSTLRPHLDDIRLPAPAPVAEDEYKGE